MRWTLTISVAGCLPVKSQQRIVARKPIDSRASSVRGTACVQSHSPSRIITIRGFFSLSTKSEFNGFALLKRQSESRPITCHLRRERRSGPVRMNDLQVRDSVETLVRRELCRIARGEIWSLVCPPSQGLRRMNELVWFVDCGPCGVLVDAVGTAFAEATAVKKIQLAGFITTTRSPGLWRGSTSRGALHRAGRPAFAEASLRRRAYGGQAARQAPGPRAFHRTPKTLSHSSTKRLNPPLSGITISRRRLWSVFSLSL